ncbi:MAG: PilC/PilY family type IV pilus protein [Amphritea sp.]|nr:PilC/PilY family type IV pilus protein [Amphritea sp.]
MKGTQLAASLVFCSAGIVALLQASDAFAENLNISQTPIQVVGAVKPNVMILMDTSGSMNRFPNRRWAPGHYFNRINQAKRAANAVIDGTDNVNFCLSRLNGSHGGVILADCGTDKNRLKQIINHLPARGQTPIAEAYYEVSRYFRGMFGHYTHGGRRYASPIQHSCQKNFAIVMTDGSPTSDGHFGGVRDPQGLGRLPNWDHSDNDSGRFYLDDIAKFAWDIDMAPHLEGKQNLHTYTIGFNYNHQMLSRAAQVGHGEYYLAGNESDLTRSLKNALGDIGQKSFTTAALGASAGSTNTGKSLYQARFNSADWSGSLYAYDIYSGRGSANYGKVNPTPVWEAGARLNQDRQNRTIITAFGTPSGGFIAKGFNWNRFNSWDRNHVFGNNYNLSRYLRGEIDQGFRSRKGPLGDIVNSAPVYVGAPSRRYISHPAYAVFKQQNKNRPAMVYVGANDGMLHGFRASDGKELMAYVPSVFLDKIKTLADRNYTHRFWVDGTPTAGDVFINNKWRTVLIGGLGAGGQSVYALDITNPAEFSEADPGKTFLWEFHDGHDTDLGYTFSRPNIVQMRDGKWYAVFGNGYNSTENDGRAGTSGDAVLYIVDIETGRLVKKIATGAGFARAPSGVRTPNGMSFVSPVSTRGDNRIESIYGGDLYGNIWKFDVNDTDPANWKLSYKLFQACAANNVFTRCDGSNYQSITARPTVTLDPKTRQPIVIFGTGRNLEVGDRNDRRLNTIYGIYDTGTPIFPFYQFLFLTPQSITAEVVQRYTDANGKRQTRRSRIVSRRHSTNGYNRGWFIHLQVPGQSLTGERVVARARVRGNQVVIPYQRFGSDPCKAGGTGGLMILDKRTGSALNYVAIDQNNDGKLDEKDLVTDPASGKKVVSSSAETGSGGTPVLTGENIYTNDKDGKPPTSNRRQDDPESLGRQSWRYFGR